MKGFVIPTESLYVHWEPVPMDWGNPQQDSFSWVEGNSEEELCEAAKRKFEDIFQIEKVTVAEGEGDVKQVTLHLSSPSESGEQPAEITTSHGVIFRRTETTYADGAMPH